MNDNKPKKITTHFPVRPIHFKGSLFSFNEELTADLLLNKFNEFVKQNNFSGGLQEIHDPLLEQHLYPVKSVPEYLYHYTNIDTLALILSNKSIMLNSLNFVDDLNEGQTNDYENLGKYCFASCWTDNSSESIPFWHLYTNNLKGVRIKLRANPFRLYEHNENNSEIQQKFKSVYPPEMIFNDHYVPLPPHDQVLQKVVYTNDDTLLFPSLLKKGDGFEQLRLGELGKYKRTEWEFQSEWRYIARIFPISISEFGKYDSSLFNEIEKRIKEKRELQFTNICFELDEDAFKEMEITLGPSTDEGEKIIAKALLKTYNPSAKLNESVLKGQIMAKKS